MEGKSCVVIGRSNIVGKPMAMLLLHQNGTVTICHSRTKNLHGSLPARRTFWCAAVGKADFVTADMVKEGAVVIDVGMNRDENGKLCGDVDFAAVEPKASLYHPGARRRGAHDHRHAAEKYGHSRQAPKRPALTRLELSPLWQCWKKYIPQRISRDLTGKSWKSALRGDAPCHHRHCFR